MSVRRFAISRMVWALVAAGVAGCDIPTSAPILEQRWVVAAPVDSVTLQDILPATVTLQNGEFRVQAVSGSASATLASLCASCAGLEGTTAQVPAFQGSTQVVVPFPASVTGVTLGTADSLAVTLTNGLGFDPLAPGHGAAGPGTLTLTMVDSVGTIVSTLTPVGNLPDQTATTYHLSLPAGQAVYGPVTVTVAVSVPTFGPIAIPANPTLGLDASTSTLGAAAATVVVASHAIDITTGSFNIDSISSSDRSHILAGALHLAVANPFGLAGGATVHFERGGQDAIPAQSVTLTGAGNEELSVSFDEATMQTLLAGGALKLHLTASVSGTGPGETVVVHPADQIDLTPRLAFTTRIGG